MNLIAFLLALILLVLLLSSRAGRITLFAVAVTGAGVLLFFSPA